MGSVVHVLHKNHDLFIVRAGDTDGDGRISTAGQFLCVFCDVTVWGCLPMTCGGMPWHQCSPGFEFFTRRCRGDRWGHGWYNLGSLWSPPPVLRGTGRQRSRRWFWRPHWGRQLWSTTLSREHLGQLSMKMFWRRMCVHWYLCLFYPWGGGGCCLCAVGGTGKGKLAQGERKSDMLASPCGGAYGGTGFCKLFFEVVDIFGVGMTEEVVHIFCHHDGADGLGNGRGGGSVVHFFLFAFTRY